MKKDRGHTVGHGCFSGVELLQCLQDFLSCERFGEFSVHFIYDTLRNCICDFIDSGGRRCSVDFLKIGYSSGCDTFLTFTLYTILVPKPQNGILLPPLRSMGVKKFRISVTFLIPMDFATLSPNGLLTVQKVIYFLSKLINFSSSAALPINICNGVKSFSFLG